MIVKNYYTLSSKLKNAWIEFEKQAESPFVYLDYVRYIYQQQRLLGYIRGVVPFFRCIESSEGEILLIAPLIKHALSSDYRMMTDIRGCGCSDFLYNPRLSDNERRNCLELLINTLGNKWHLRRIPSDSLLGEQLGKNSRHIKTTACCRIYVRDYNEWFSSLSSSVRQNIRTAYNRLKRDGHTFEITVAGNAFDNARPVEAFNKIKEESLELYINRQTSKYHKAGLLTLWFKKAVFRIIKHDSKSLYNNRNSITVLLRIDGKAAAYMGCLMSYDKKQIVVPRLAIDDTFRFYSPGYVMICELMRHIHDCGVEILDLSRGVEKYKTDLSGSLYDTFNIKNN